MTIDRATLLRIVLVALGLGALSGVAAIFIPVSGVWRLAGVSILGAVVAAVMMPVSRWTEKPETRAGGALGLLVCVAIFLIGTAVIWENLLPRGLVEFLVVAVIALIGLGLPAAAFLRLIERPGWRWPAIVAPSGAAVAFATALIGGVDGLARALGVYEEQFYASSAAIAFGTLCLAVSLVGFRETGKAGRDPMPLRWLAAPGTLVAVGTAVWGIFFGKGGYEWVPVSGYALAATTAHAVLLSRSPSGKKHRWLRYAAIGAAVLTAGLIVAASIGQWAFMFFDERPIYGAGILAFSATFALVVMDRLSSNRRVELVGVNAASTGDAARAGIRPEAKIECPRCSRAQSIPLGEAGALCVQCKLHIAVEVRAARCGRCGYNLSDLRGPTCPECGAAVA